MERFERSAMRLKKMQWHATQPTWTSLSGKKIQIPLLLYLLYKNKNNKGDMSGTFVHLKLWCTKRSLLQTHCSVWFPFLLRVSRLLSRFSRNGHPELHFGFTFWPTCLRDPANKWLNYTIDFKNTGVVSWRSANYAFTIPTDMETTKTLTETFHQQSICIGAPR